jgi:hypothetical protein
MAAVMANSHAIIQRWLRAHTQLREWAGRGRS